MQLYQLEQFQVLAHLEHMTMAADTLHISQSALSQSIARLEQELGVALFDRHGRKISLNKYGREFLSRVENAFRELDDGRKILADMQKAGASRIRFGNAASASLAANILRLYRRQNPDAYLEYCQGKKEDLVHMLKSGETDFFLSTMRPLEPELSGKKLGSLYFELVVPADGPFKDRDSVDLKELKDFRFIGPVRSNEVRQIFEAICFSMNFIPFFSYESNDGSLMLEAVRDGCGILYTLNGSGEAFAHADEKVLERAGLRRLAIKNDYVLPQLWCVRLKDHYLSDAVKGFLQFLDGLFY